MILPYELQPCRDQIGKQYLSPFAGILWNAVYVGTTHRDLDVFNLDEEQGRTGRGYNKHGTWLVVLDD